MGYNTRMFLVVVAVLVTIWGPESGAVTRNWKEAADGDWGNTNNWTPVGSPSATDDVVIAVSGDYVVRLTGNSAFRSLSLGGSNGVQTLEWISGTISGDIQVNPNGRLNLATNGSGWTFSGVLSNSGWIVLRSGSAGVMSLNSGTRLENLPGGVLEQQVDGGLVMNSGTGQFHNRGVWRRSGGGGVAYLGLGLVFTNAGSVLVETGALEFTYGLTSSGAFVVSNGASLRFKGGTFNVSAGHGIEGPGYYGVPSGSVVWNGPVAESDFRFDGGSLSMSNLLSGRIHWKAGTLGGAWGIASGGCLNIVSNTGGWTLSGTLTNAGEIIWRSGSSSLLYLNNGTRLENLPGGVLEQQVDGGLVMNSGTGQFHNRGVWRRSGGGGVANLGAGLVFTNAGTVLVETGALEFTYGFTSSGSFVVSNGAALRFKGGTFNVLEGHGIEGPGYYGIPSGSVVWNGPVDEPDFRFDGGSLTMSNLLSGRIHWKAGTLGGAWGIASGGCLNIVSNTGGWTLSGTLTNAGEIVWRSGSSSLLYLNNGTRLENLPGGVLDQQVDGGIRMSSGAGQFHNRGVWRRSGGGGVAYLGPGLVFTNAGSVLVETGALEFTYGLTSSGAFVVSNGASLRFNGGTFNALVGHGIEGPGYYGVPSGSVVWNGPVAEPDFRFDGGSLTLTGALSGAISWYSGTLGGSWVIRPGGSLNIVSNSGGWYLGGILTNQGQVVWRTGSSGTFYWMGGARLENEGVLDLQVNGTLQSLSGAGVLNNSGQITKSDGIGTTTVLSSINLTNSGTIQVHKGILSLPVSCVSSGGEFSVDIRETNDYGRITSGGGLDLPSRVELVVKEGYRPPIGALFNVVGFTGYQGQLFEFIGIDLGDGLRLAPSLLPSGLTFQAVAYDTNQLHRLHMEGCGSGWLLWWPIALSGLELGTTSQLDVPTWTGVEAPYHNRVVTADTSVRFFRLGTGLVTRVNVPISP